MHDANAKRTCGVDKKLSEMILSEIKELEAAFNEKFGNEFVGLSELPLPKEQNG